MKFLIWFLTYFVGAFVMVLLDYFFSFISGGMYNAGYLFDIIIFILCGYLARNFCKKWDTHKADAQKTAKKLRHNKTDEFMSRMEEYRRRRDVIYNNQRPDDSDFGYSKSNPICTSSIGSSDKYLSLLRTMDDRELFWIREGSFCIDSIKDVQAVMVDRYYLYLDGEFYKEIYICPYGHSSKYVPKGLKLVESDTRDYGGSILAEAIDKGMSKEELLLQLNSSKENKNKVTDEKSVGGDLIFGDKKMSDNENDLIEEKIKSEEPITPKVLFCRKCGAKLYEDSDYCHKCGIKVIKEII